MQQTFSENLTVYKKQSEALLQKLFDDLEKDPSYNAEDVHLMRDAVLSGGKRLRGYLVYLGYSLSGKEINDAVIRFSLGLELGHAGLLVQDDVFDEDVVRRNKPALHTQLQKNPERSAILLSDMLVAIGYQQLLDAEMLLENKLNALSVLNNYAFSTIEGEHADLFYSYEDTDLAIEDIAALKTASYTTLATLYVGFLLSGKDSEALRKISYHLGVLFQLRDDFLPVFSEADQAGKNLFSDFEKERASFLIGKVRKYVSRQEIAQITSKQKLFAVVPEQELHATYKTLVTRHLDVIKENIALLKAEGFDTVELEQCVDFIINRQV